MQLHSLGHASYFLLTKGIGILVDPVLGDFHQQGLFETYPKRTIYTKALERVSVVLISHSHQDHFDIESLAMVPREAEIYIPPDVLMSEVLKMIGFKTIKILKRAVRLAGDVVIAPTISQSGPQECGFVIDDGRAKLWNQVDTIVNSATLKSVERKFGTMDLALVRWQPLLDHIPAHGGSISFPYEEYRRILRAARDVRARYLALGACGFKYRGRGAWMNSVVFPQSRRRALADIGRIRSQGKRSVYSFDSGDVMHISSNQLRISRNASPIANRMEEWSDGEFVVDPWVSNRRKYAQPIKTLDNIAKTILSRLKEWCARSIEETVSYRRWEVIYLLRIVSGSVYRHISIDFRGRKPSVTDNMRTDASMICRIESFGLGQLLTGSVAWDRVLLAGDLFHWHRIYRISKGKMYIPIDVELENPLFRILDDKSVALNYYRNCAGRAAQVVS